MLELHTLSAIQIGRKVNNGELRPTEVVQYFLDRIEKLNPALNAFVYVKEQEALEAARKLEERLKAGQDVGPFAGVPFALKDFLPSKKGWTNTHGGVKSLLQTDPYSSVFCEAMEEAGGIAIGKTNAPAFGFRGVTDNKLYGPTHNPHNLDYNAGGSSGGSAAAVAGGLVPIAEGGDAGGSIRIPAAWCGCYGFKASAGLIPNVCRPDAWTATHPYCTPGGLTKTVEDAQVLFDYMAKYDPRDPLSRPQLNHTPLNLDPATLRIAVTEDFGIFGKVDPEIRDVLETTVRCLKLSGYKVTWVDPLRQKGYTVDELADLWCQSISLDSSVEIELAKRKGFDLIKDHRDELPDEFVYWNDRAISSSLLELYEIHKARTVVYDAIEGVFSKYDLLLSPVTTCLPVKNATDRNTLGPEGHDRLISFAETFLYNFSGHPAISIPMDVSKDKLPIGLQLAGPRFEDDRVLAATKKIFQNI